MRNALLVIGFLSVFAVATAAAQRAPEVETFQYTVQRGDTCGGIAQRFYGQWRRYDVIQRFNPELGEGVSNQRGRCGPYLVPGLVLTLPRTLDGVPPPGEERPSEPDARVTAVRRRVQAREPNRTDWRRAERGLGLFRGWRVNTLEESAAEVTFRDRSKVHLRENTLVIIYGGRSRSARRRTAQATLERGALRSRLGELRLQVDTPSATAGLAGGEALVAVDPEGTSRVSNFEGGTADVRGAAGGRVRVRPGFGSKVRRGRRPSRPRPLPPAPHWSPEVRTAFVGIAREGGTLTGSWEPVPGARRYRVEIGSGEPGGAVVAATEVPAEVTRFEVHRLPAGTYWVRVSTVDGDFFESRPSEPRTMRLVLAELRQPGETSAPRGEPDPSVAPTTPRVLSGTRLQAPDGARCAVGDDAEPAAELLLEGEGPREVRCVAEDGTDLGTFTVELARPEVRVGEAERGALRRGATETLRLRLESELPLPAELTVRGEGVTVRNVERRGDELVLTLDVAEDAPDTTVLDVVSGDARLAQLSLRTEAVDDEGNEPLADARGAPEEGPVEHPPTYAQEALSAVPHPTLLALQDDRRRGHSLLVGVGSFGDGLSGDGHWRLAVGGEIALGAYARVGAGTQIDFAADGAPAHRGNRDVRVWGAYHVLRSQRWGLTMDLTAWLPVGKGADGGLADFRLAPSLSTSLRLGDRLTLRTRQGAILDLAPDGPRTWASAYGVDVRLLGAFAVGLEADVAIGRDLGNDAILAYGGVGLGLSLRGGPVQASLGVRYGLGDDWKDDVGALSLAASLRVSMR